MLVYNNIEENNNLSDEEVIELVRKGDDDKFGLLIDRYEAKMLRYAKKFLFQAENAEDLVQEVFIKAYSNIEGFDLNLKFSPWLYRIAHNRFINEIKKKNKERLFCFDLDIFLPKIFAKDRTDKEVIEKEARELLDKVIDKLDSKYREVLVLYYFEELNYREISDILHIPISVVGIRLNRAKKMMRKIIKI